MASTRPVSEESNNGTRADDAQPEPRTDDAIASKMAADGGQENVEESLDIDVAIETEQVIHKAPDGGWGWFVLLAAVVMRILTSGMVRSNGLFYVRYLERFNGTAAQTAWITSLNMTCNLLMGPFVNILCNRFTARKLCFIGATMWVTSLLISGFSTSLVYMYFSYGVLGGIGRAFIGAPITILLGYYFEKRRSLAFGLASAGMGIGGFTITPAIGPLFEEYGFTGTFIFMSGLTLNMFVCVLLLRPIDAQTKLATASAPVKSRTPDKNNAYSSCDHIQDEENVMFISELSSTGSVHLKNPKSMDQKCDKHQEHVQAAVPRRKSVVEKAITSIKDVFKNDGSKKKLFSFSVFKDIRFLTMVLATFLHVLPTIGLFLPALAKDRGITDVQAGLLLSIQAFTDTVTRVTCGFVMDLKPLRRLRPYMYNVATFMQGVVFFSFPSATTFTGFIGLCCLQGVASGVRMAQRSVILVDILGVDRLTSSNAIIQAVMGIGTLVGPPISGLLKDTYGKYDYTFYFGGTAVLLAGMILAGGNIRNYCNEQSRVNDKTEEAGDETVEAELSDARTQTDDVVCDSDKHSKHKQADKCVNNGTENVTIDRNVENMSDRPVVNKIQNGKKDEKAKPR